MKTFGFERFIWCLKRPSSNEIVRQLYLHKKFFKVQNFIFKKLDVCLTFYKVKNHLKSAKNGLYAKNGTSGYFLRNVWATYMSQRIPTCHL